MANFTLTLNCDNAAFEDAPDEVARILTETARALLSGRERGTLIDINGNTVGTFTLEQ